MGIVAKVLVSFGHLHRPIRNYIKASQSFFQIIFGIMNSHREMVISNDFCFFLLFLLILNILSSKYITYM